MAATAPDDSALDSEFEQARAAVYDLLAAAFDGDSEVLAASMVDGSFERLAAALPVECDVSPLVASDPDVESLSVGYDNLFVVPGPHYAPPFASGYESDPTRDFESDSAFQEDDAAGELYGDPAARMARRYERAGFDPERGDGVPDHLAAQLSFLAALAGERARIDDPEAREALRGIERETLADMAWLDAFDEAVAERDRAEGVFAALARLTRVVVAWDASRATDGDGR